jgi:hypothetical protein
VDEVADQLDVGKDLVDRIAIISAVSGAGGSELYEAAAYYKPCPAAQEILEKIGWHIDDHLRNRTRCSARDAALCDSVIVEEITLDEAGQRVPFTGEAMRRTLEKHTGLSTRNLAEHRSELREARRLAAGRPIVLRLAEAQASLTVAELANASGLTSDEVAGMLGEVESLRRGRRNTWTVGVEDASVLREMRRVSLLPGGSPLSAPFFDKHRGPGIPGSVRITQRFNTWNSACAAAAVPARQREREYSRRWTEKDLLQWVRRYLDETGRAATYSGFTLWLRRHSDEGAPSAQTIRNNLGKWRDVVELAMVSGKDEADVYSPSDGKRVVQESDGSLLGLPETRWDPEETDSEVLGTVRREQAHLRRHLLSGQTEGTCAICGRLLPAQLLIAAHIVPRRLLDHAGRRDFGSAAMLACVLGCDALFEWGYVAVDEAGRIVSARPAETGQLRELVHAVVGRECTAYSTVTNARFAQHRDLHKPDSQASSE